MVYFITDNEYIKIGKANNILKRLRIIQTSNPRNLTVLKVFKGGYTLENNIHSLLKEYHFKREWYKIDHNLMFKIIKKEFPTLIEIPVKSLNLSNALKRKVIRTDKDGSNKVIYESITEAESETGIDHSSITNNCRNNRKSAGGYKWKYLD
jgi:hypothetical protein